MLLIWFIGCVAAGLQYVYDVSFDYCERKKISNKNLLPYETGMKSFLIMKSWFFAQFMLIKFNDYRRHRNKFIAAACKINKLLTMAQKIKLFQFSFTVSLQALLWH